MIGDQTIKTVRDGSVAAFLIGCAATGSVSENWMKVACLVGGVTTAVSALMRAPLAMRELQGVKTLGKQFMAGRAALRAGVTY